MLALATCETPDGGASITVPTIAHADCIDDGRMVDRLADVADVAPPQSQADADAAKTARIGAIEHALATALRTLQAAHAVGIAPGASGAAATAVAPTAAGGDDLPDLPG